VLVTVITPVIVPAAPWPWPGEAVMCVQAVEVLDADVEVVVEAAVVVVIDDDDVVDVAVRVVVVTLLGVLGLLLHAARTTPAPATSASAQRWRITLRNPPGALNRGTAGTGPPVRRACRPLPPRRRGPG
jgi:hypothetical protein